MYTPVYEQCGDLSSDTALVLIEENFNKLKSKTDWTQTCGAKICTKYGSLTVTLYIFSHYTSAVQITVAVSFFNLNALTSIWNLFILCGGFFSSSLKGALSSCERLRTSWRSSRSFVSQTPKTGHPSTTFPGQFGSECCHGTQAQSEVKANVDTGISLWSGDSSLSCFPHWLSLEKLKAESPKD